MSRRRYSAADPRHTRDAQSPPKGDASRPAALLVSHRQPVFSLLASGHGRSRRFTGSHSHVRSLIFSLGLTLVFAAPAPGQVFESVGTRALGMAGAFVAVSDDATAAYWNPAGLPSGALFSLLVDHSNSERWSDPSQPDTPAAAQVGTIVALSTDTFAFSYYRLRINQVERPHPPEASSDLARKDQRGEATLRSVETHNLALTGAQLLYPGVSLGTTLRFVRGSVGVAPGDLAETSDDLLRQAENLGRRGDNDVDLDVGLMLGTQTVRVGVVARNLLEATFDTPDGSSLRLERQVRAGVGIRTVGGLLVAADVDLNRSEAAVGDRRNLAVGAEHWFGDWLGVRGGARFNLEDDDPQAVGTFGLSVALSSGVYLDAQLTRGRHSVERGWGIAGRVGF